MPEQDRVPQVSTGGTYSEEEARKYIFVLGNQLRVEKSYVEYYKQRVERLTRERDEARAEVEKERAYADASNQDAVAAEARLARCVEAGNHLRGFAAGTDLGKAYIEDWDAAAKGGE